jgi:hypothetical protein
MATGTQVIGKGALVNGGPGAAASSSVRHSPHALG